MVHAAITCLLYNICHRCGHDNCPAGKPPFNHGQCEFYTPCSVPMCSLDTHFSSICPRVYGTDGYRHFEMKTPVTLNPTARPYTAVRNNSTVVSPVGKSKQPNADPAVNCVLPTVMAYLKHGSSDKRYLVRCLLDTGSQASLIREGIIPLASSTNAFQNYEITTAGGSVIKETLRVMDCEIEDLSGTVIRKINLVEMKKPCGDVQVIRKHDLEVYPHLRDVEINEAQSPVIDILLGVNIGDLTATDERIIGKSDHEPVAARCPLGWFIQGGSGGAQVLDKSNLL